MASASPVMLSSTWRREAPSARSSANSRRRCATVIEKALKMMKAPTSTATPPKREQAGVEERADGVADLLGAASEAASSPVLTSASSGSDRTMRAASVLGRDALGGDDVDLRDPARHAEPRLAVLERRVEQQGAAERRLAAEGEHAGDARLVAPVLGDHREAVGRRRAPRPRRSCGRCRRRRARSAAHPRRRRSR